MRLLSYRRCQQDQGDPERGAVLVEFALVLPLLISIVFGIVEFGLFFRDYLTVANTTRTGARVGSAAGSSYDADYQILQAIKSAATALPTGANAIEDISIFKSSASDGTVPAACKTASQTSQCNHYTKTDLSRPITEFGCLASSPDKYWCPTTRSDSQSAGTDYVGVYLKMTHTFATSLFGPSKTITDTVVMRIEPKRP
jgi:Flp pilus assembly protein TadG